jgi:glycosyltransferase involved in cell wall biosynthesis
VGGSSTVAAQLAEKLTNAGHTVLILTGTYKKAKLTETKDGYFIHRLPTWVLPESKFTLNFDINFALRWGNSSRLKRILDDFKPDVIHCHGQFLDLTWKALKYAKLRDVPSILTLHTRLVNPTRLIHLILYFLDKTIVFPILLLRKPNKIVIIDKIFKDYAAARYRASERDMVYIPVGVDLQKFDAIQFNRNSKQQTKLILSVGHVIPVRNRLALVSALPRILEAHPNAKMRILGNIYQDEFLSLAQKLGVEQAIETPGAIPSSQVPFELSKAAVEIHDIQGYGISIASLEAMAFGIPCIMATDADYFPHAPMTAGFHFIQVKKEDSDEIANQVIYALDHPEESMLIGRQGSIFIKENFNIEAIIDKHLAAYSDLLN